MSKIDNQPKVNETETFEYSELLRTILESGEKMDKMLKSEMRGFRNPYHINKHRVVYSSIIKHLNAKKNYANETDEKKKKDYEFTRDKFWQEMHLQLEFLNDVQMGSFLRCVKMELLNSLYKSDAEDFIHRRMILENILNILPKHLSDENMILKSELEQMREEELNVLS